MRGYRDAMFSTYLVLCEFCVVHILKVKRVSTESMCKDAIELTQATTNLVPMLLHTPFGALRK